MNERKLGAHGRRLVGLVTVMVALPAAVAFAAPAAAAPASEAAAVGVEGDDWHFPEVKRGSRGDVVRIVQRLLRYHGHPTDIDGIFGPQTERRVRDLQSDAGLPVTGVVGEATWERLVVELRRGDHSGAVRVWQWLLDFHGFPLVQDGIFGPKTERATRGFQKEWGLPVSGVANERTWRVAVANVKA